MELAIPLILAGGLYLINNNNNKQIIRPYNEGFKGKFKGTDKEGTKSEGFENMGSQDNITNTNNLSQSKSDYKLQPNNQFDLIDNVMRYSDPNKATDKYFNQNLYEERKRAGLPVDSNIPNIYSIRGDYMSSDDFKHNNMVPFTGKKPQGDLYNANNAESFMDNYVGAGSQTIKKVEQSPLFKPEDNVQWTHGTPIMTDFFQSRQNNSLKDNMTKPFESVMVGPGLDQGYTTSGTNGYNSGMEVRDKWMPKTVDELRVLTNPKDEYGLGGLEGPSMAFIKNVGIEGKVEKNRPDRFFVNSQDRWLTTTGSQTKGELVPEYIMKPSLRNDVSVEQQCIPNSVIKTASYVPKQYDGAKKIQLEGFDVKPASAIGYAPSHEDKDNYHKSHRNVENKRSKNSQPVGFGAGFSSAIGAVLAPVMDVLKPSRKEEHICNMRVYGNGIINKSNGPYTVVEEDVIAPTIKETTIYSSQGFVGRQIENSAYAISEQQAIENQRTTTGNKQQMGPAGSKYGNGNTIHDSVVTSNEVKDYMTSASGRTNMGNMSLFNSQMNVSYAKPMEECVNNREWVKTGTVSGGGAGPSKQTYGQQSVVNPYQYSMPIENVDNRLNPELLSAFKANPYTQSLHSVA